MRTEHNADAYTITTRHMDAKTLEALAKKVFEETDVRNRLEARGELRTAACVAAMHEVHMPYVRGMTREYEYARRALYKEYWEMVSVPWTEREYRDAIRNGTDGTEPETGYEPSIGVETKRKLKSCAQALLAVCAGWALAAITQYAAR